MSSDSSQQFTNYKGESVNPNPKNPDEGYPRAQFKFDKTNESHMKLLTGTDYSPTGQKAHESLMLHPGGEMSIRAEGPRTQPSGKGYAKSGVRKPSQPQTTKAPEPVKPAEAPKKKTTSAPVKKTVAQKPKVEVDVDKARASKRLDTPDAIARRNAALKAAKEKKNPK